MHCSLSQFEPESPLPLSSRVVLVRICKLVEPPLLDPFSSIIYCVIIPGISIAMDSALLQEAIITACTDHKEQNWRKPKYRACITIGTEYFVKFGASETLKAEAATQTYMRSHAESDSAAPRIAKVLFLFERKFTTYIVMEYIELVGPADPGRKAKALEWLSRVVPPPDDLLGPVGGGRIRHDVFKDGVAPLNFEDVGALDRYFGRVSSACCSFTRLSPPACR